MQQFTKDQLHFISKGQIHQKTLQNHIKDNDANGIGWFNINCLNNLIQEEKINLNQHCKILIKKFFRKYIF